MNGIEISAKINELQNGSTIEKITCQSFILWKE